MPLPHGKIAALLRIGRETLARFRVVACGGGATSAIATRP